MSARKPSKCSYDYDVARFAERMGCGDDITAYDLMREIAAHADLQTTEDMLNYEDYEQHADELGPHRSPYIHRIVTEAELRGDPEEDDLNKLLDELSLLEHE